jgi:hypothetical protein
MNVASRSFTVLHPGQGLIFSTFNNFNVLIFHFSFNLTFKVPYFLLQLTYTICYLFLTRIFFRTKYTLSVTSFT